VSKKIEKYFRVGICIISKFLLILSCLMIPPPNPLKEGEFRLYPPLDSLCKKLVIVLQNALKKANPPLSPLIRGKMSEANRGIFVIFELTHSFCTHSGGGRWINLILSK